jgi:hypothetical protein
MLCSRHAPQVNHFSESRQLCRKDLLARHLERMRAMHAGTRLAARFELLPSTFVLPKARMTPSCDVPAATCQLHHESAWEGVSMALML